MRPVNSCVNSCVNGEGKGDAPGRLGLVHWQGCVCGGGLVEQAAGGVHGVDAAGAEGGRDVAEALDEHRLGASESESDTGQLQLYLIRVRHRPTAAVSDPSQTPGNCSCLSLPSEALDEHRLGAGDSDMENYGHEEAAVSCPAAALDEQRLDRG